MTGAVRCAVPATKNDLTRAEAADGPQGSEAAGDELMTREVGPLGRANGAVCWRGDYFLRKII